MRAAITITKWLDKKVAGGVDVSHIELPAEMLNVYALKAWFAEVEASSWSSPADIKDRYRSASILGDQRVVFNICGNKYRLVVKISYKNGVVLIRFIGTHKEYDAINAEEV